MEKTVKGVPLFVLIYQTLDKKLAWHIACIRDEQRTQYFDQEK
jgi:hypothetical protein